MRANINRIVVLAFTMVFGVLPASGQGVSLAVAHQGYPAELVELQHTKNDWLSAAKIHNFADDQITAYRVGWAYIVKGKILRIEYGKWTRVPSGIRPKSNFCVPSQHVAPDISASNVIFFIDAVRFGSGSQWNFDERKLIG